MHDSFFRRAVRRVALAALLVAPVVLSACETRPGGPVAPIPQTDLSALSGANYRLGVGDKVKVTVLGQPELTGEADVDAAGRVVVALAGDIMAAGRTVSEVQNDIQSKYAGEILRNPKVTVQVVQYRPITVLGQVKTPGRYAFSFGLNVRSAVALAGGFDRRGSAESVIIYRGGKAYEGRADTILLPGDEVEVLRRVF